MMGFFYSMSEFLRPVLFLALFFYLPLKSGSLLEIVIAPPTSEKIKETRQQLIINLAELSLRGLIRGPFRLLGILYFTLWLAIDKYSKLIVALFLITLLPLFFSQNT
jgi:hypothetical protein